MSRGQDLKQSCPLYNEFAGKSTRALEILYSHSYLYSNPKVVNTRAAVIHYRISGYFDAEETTWHQGYNDIMLLLLLPVTVDFFVRTLLSLVNRLSFQNCRLISKAKLSVMHSEQIPQGESKISLIIKKKRNLLSCWNSVYQTKNICSRILRTCFCYCKLSYPKLSAYQGQ